MKEVCNQRLHTKPCADNCKLNFLSYLLCYGGVRFPGGKEINMSHCVSDPSPCVHSLHSLLCRLCPHPRSDPAFDSAQPAQNSTEVRIPKNGLTFSTCKLKYVPLAAASNSENVTHTDCLLLFCVPRGSNLAEAGSSLG